MHAWHVWLAVQTQWRTGAAGATGLSWSGVRTYLDEEGITGDERRHVWACVRAAEQAVLQAWAARRQREADRREFERAQQGMRQLAP